MAQRRIQRRLAIEELEPRTAPGAFVGTGLQAFSAVPLAFIENQGQIADPAVAYLFQGDGANILFTDEGPTFQVVQKDEQGNQTALVFSSAVVGARSVRPEGAHELPTRVNYLKGADPATWSTNIATYGVIAYRNILDGVDLEISGDRTSMKYEFHVAPQSDPSCIAIRYNGIEGLSIGQDGTLRVHTALGDLVDGAPYIYQEIDGVRVTISGAYRLLDQFTYAFEITGAYDTTKPLVIDPDLVWSTFLGGICCESGMAVKVDAQGNTFVAGFTASPQFPTTPGVYGECPFGDCMDVFVAKLSADGSSLVYSTYLGGSQNDVAYDIAIDQEGYAYITGYTCSPDFPIHEGSCSVGYSGGFSDVFVAKISPAGDALLCSTLLGGESDDMGLGLALDNAGNVYVVGFTNSADFPTTLGAFDTDYNGDGDGFIAKIDGDGNGLTYSTFLGGTGWDYASKVAVDSSGRATIIGYTESSDFPITLGAYQTTYGGYGDAFVAQLSSDGAALSYSTFLGGQEWDEAYSLAVDATSQVWVAGYTESFDFPAASNAYDATYNGNGDAFFARLSADGSTLVYASYFGGSEYDLAYGIALDSGGALYLAGVTGSLDFPITADAYDSDLGGCYDVFLAKFSGDGTSLSYSTYFGGTDWEEGAFLAVDAQGFAYITGSTPNSDFPISSCALDGSFNGGMFDAFVLKMSLPTTVTFDTGAAPSLSELALGPVTVTVFRVGTTGDLPVYYTLSGAATAGQDYEALPGVVTIPDGESSATITLRPLDDFDEEGAEDIVLTLLEGPYVIGGSRTVTVMIQDNDQYLTVLPGQQHTFEDEDGSTVTISLQGPGTLAYTLMNGETTGAPIGQIILRDTTLSSVVTIQSTGGQIPGTAFTNILIENPPGAEALGTLNAAGIVMAAGGRIEAQGPMGTITLGDIEDDAAIVAAGGGIRSLTAQNLGERVTVTASADIGTITVSSVGGGARLEAEGRIGSLTVKGSVAAGTVVSAGARGIGSVVLNGDASLSIQTPGKVSSVKVVGSTATPHTLSGTIEVGELGSLYATYSDLCDLTVRAVTKLGAMNVRHATRTLISTGFLGTVVIQGSLTDSRLLAGLDIGADLQLGTGDDGAFAGAAGNIVSVQVWGDMSGSDIAAGIAPGADGAFGTADDTVVVSPTLQGTIGTITIQGRLTGGPGGQKRGIVAHGAISSVKVGGVALNLPWLLGDIVVAPFWR